MTDDELWGHLAGALIGKATTPTTLRVLETVVPVAVQYGDARVAQALREAADALDDGDWLGQEYGTHPVTYLRDKANALEAGR